MLIKIVLLDNALLLKKIINKNNPGYFLILVFTLVPTSLNRAGIYALLVRESWPWNGFRDVSKDDGSYGIETGWMPEKELTVMAALPPLFFL